MVEVEKKSKFSIKIIAGIISVAILLLLIFAGPAAALNLGLTGFSVSEPEQGVKTSTNASILIRTDERIEFGEIVLQITGPTTKTCLFNLNGSLISGCEGVEIHLIGTNVSYGYGYGYGQGYPYDWGQRNGFTNGLLTYNITLDTLEFNVGDYNIILKTSLGTHDFSSGVIPLTIKTETTPPEKVTNLRDTKRSTNYVRWNWNNPSDSDFAYNMIYLNGAYKGTTTSTQYTASGLSQNKVYTLSIKTVDDNGNINHDSATDSARTCVKICSFAGCKVYCK